MKNLLLITMLAVFGSSMYAVSIYSEDFSTDTSSMFTPVANAGDAEASLTHNAGGFLELSAVNPDEGIGKAYIWLANVGVPALSAEDVTISFDLKYDGPMVGAGVHFLTDNPGSGFTPLFDMQTLGINDSTWTTVEHTISGINPGHTNIQMQFQLAAGAFAGAGGTLLLDNINVSQVPEPSTYALIAGFVTFAFEALRRKLK